MEKFTQQELELIFDEMEDRREVYAGVCTNREELRHLLRLTNGILRTAITLGANREFKTFPPAGWGKTLAEILAGLEA